MKAASLVKVLWYNATSSSYQSGTWNDYNQLIASSTDPYNIQPLERFNDASDSRLKKIVRELNKCTPRHLR